MYCRDFKALFYAGGHGPMFDLADNQDVSEIAAKIYENGGVIGAVCHGTVGKLVTTESLNLSQHVHVYSR